jgi:hypothetical protein
MVILLGKGLHNNSIKTTQPLSIALVNFVSCMERMGNTSSMRINFLKRWKNMGIIAKKLND